MNLVGFHVVTALIDREKRLRPAQGKTHAEYDQDSCTKESNGTPSPDNPPASPA